MTDLTTPPMFDGHNDALLKLFTAKTPDAKEGFITGHDGHIDLPKARRGGFGGGFFAIYVPSPRDSRDTGTFLSQMSGPSYDLPLPAPIDQPEALPVVMAEVAILSQLERAGALKICTKTQDIRHCLETGTIAAVMHIEGAEAIDANFDTLEVLYRAGLRSLGPVWSRPTAFAHGVPFRFPSTGDTGPGLSDAGKALVRECNRLGIMLDMSHLNEAGFWDVVRLSDAPIVATHSNAHAICPTARNLTDRQLDAIRDSDGMVGVNFATAFLRPDGQMNADTPLELMLRHLDHLISHLGEDRVGFGSDFDGAMIPEAIGNVAGLPALRKEMRAHGYDNVLMEKIFFKNWLRVLAQSWGE